MISYLGNTLLKKTLIAVSLTAALCLFTILVSNHKSTALTGSSFNPGRIIDDGIFYNGNSMSAEQIQSFLVAKGSTCDTNGTGLHSYLFNPNTGEVNNWNQTSDGDVWVTTSRAVYGARVADYGGEWRGSRAPYICLSGYTQTTTNIAPESGICNGYTGAPNENVGQILFKIAQSCGINPQVMIVLLQKEQSLITDSWPWGIQYMKATGVSCPDSYPASWAPYNCDPDYLGFFKQMYYGAHRFKRYKANANNYNYRAGRNNTIYWHPNTGCGTSNVFIANQATAALYIYTPYRPNQAALDNLYGTGDGCSSYGNRNFWRMFNDWFGATIAVDLPGCHEATNTTRACIWMLRNPNGQPYYTASVNARDSLVAGDGYSYVWRPFFGNAVMLPGNIPVYRLDKGNGGSLLTADLSEYNALVSAGLVGHGVDFYADPPGSNSGYTVHRLYKPSTGEHIWVNDQDKSIAINNWGFGDEGIAFSSISPVRQEQSPPSGKNLVYRFYVQQTNAHFWTTDLAERDRLINSGYQYEGVAWHGSTNSSNKPVFRLYSPIVNKHLYTTSVGERDNLSANHGWRYEGISYYVSSTASGTPVYRLYAPSLRTHLLTQDMNERNVLISSGRWNNEGIAWYQP